MTADAPPYDQGGPCRGCAFRPGTEANQSEHTIALARLCVEGLRYFHCHEHPHFCRGWMAAVNLRGVPVTDDEKARCDIAGLAADAVGDLIANAALRQRALAAAGDLREGEG